MHNTSKQDILVTADLVVLTLRDRALHVGLLRRADAPFKGREALPGVIVRPEQDADVCGAAIRAMRDKTGLDGFFVEQLRTFSGPARDPRGWSLSVAHLALVPWDRLGPLVDGGSGLLVRPVAAVLGGLPFDHDAILAEAMARLRGKGAYSTLPARLLPPRFTLAALRDAYAVVLGGEPIDPSSFRRKMLDMNVLTQVGRAATGGRDATLYELRDGPTVFPRRI